MTGKVLKEGFEPLLWRASTGATEALPKHHRTGGPPGMSSLTVVKKLLTSALLVLVASLVLPALAAADAPDVTSASGTIAAGPNAGDRTVSVFGNWAWTTHHSDCNTN